MSRGASNSTRNDQEKMLQTLKERRSQAASKPDSQSKESQKTIKDLDSRIAALEKKLGTAVANEALSDLAILLAHTNISESCFVDIMKTAAFNTPEAVRMRNFEEIFNSKFNENK